MPRWCSATPRSAARSIRSSLPMCSASWRARACCHGGVCDRAESRRGATRRGGSRPRRARGRGRRRRARARRATLATDRQHAPWTMARARRRSTSASRRCASASTNWQQQRRVLAEEYRLLAVAAGVAPARGLRDDRTPGAPAHAAGRQHPVVRAPSGRKVSGGGSGELCSGGPQPIAEKN